MVDEQLRARDIRDRRVLQAMGSVPRHRFVPDDVVHLAYGDCPLPIGRRQTISQPYIVALMSELLELRGPETVLEVGTGSGYQAAVLARLAGHVVSLERIGELAEAARQVLQSLGVTNVEVVVTDGSRGFPPRAPYQGILVAAAAPQVPRPLLEQLDDGGRLVAPVGGIEGQVLECWTRRGDRFEHLRSAPVSFVPLLGEHGWRTDEPPG
jgi:protein-L-isoaspartate(D-aspartate) O-methyltransferase